MKIAIVNVNLEYKFNDDVTESEIMDFIQNVELPENYVSDSFEFVKIISEKD